MSGGHSIGHRLFRQHKGYESPWRGQLAANPQLRGKPRVFHQRRWTRDTCRRRQFRYEVQNLLWLVAINYAIHRFHQSKL